MINTVSMTPEKNTGDLVDTFGKHIFKENR